jgi:hypothetical protein
MAVLRILYICSYSIDIYPTADGVSLTILDTKTGEQTQVLSQINSMKSCTYFLVLLFYYQVVLHFTINLLGSKAIIGEGTPATSLLKNLPTPKQQVVVGVFTSSEIKQDNTSC